MAATEPLWLILGIVICSALAFFFRLRADKRLVALQRFAAHQLIGRLTSNISIVKRRWKNVLVIGAVFLLFATLARPHFGHEWIEVQHKGIDLLFALDTSKSMLAEDIKPNRLQRAKLAILDFIRRQDGDRVGLLPFAGSAFLMCPLTIDYNAFEESLATVNTELIPLGGTNIAAVIEKAIEVLNNGANHKILIILTDGENLQGDALQAAEEAAKQGLKIFTVGVGTAKGELIPLAGGKNPGFVKDQTGSYVTSRLDEKSLGQLADTSGGLYVPLGPSGEGLEIIYQQKLALIPKEILGERRHKVPIERFEWPLALAILLLTVDLLLGERKTPFSSPFVSLSKTVRRVFSRSGKTGIVVLLLLVLCGNEKALASAGETAYSNGDYLQAAEYYRKKLADKPADPELLFNFGAAAYKNNMFDDAIEAFSGALKSDNIDLQKKAYYNRGNSQYQKGLETRQAEPETTAAGWRQALESLKAALQLDPKDADAKHNQELITKQLAELEAQLQKQQQQRQQEKNQSQADKQKDGDKRDQDQQKGQEKHAGSSPAGDQQKQNQPESQPEDKTPPQQSGADKRDNDQQEPGESASELQDGQKKEENQTAKDAVRRQLGKMTKEEAEQLLNTLKKEEGNLNFVPKGQRSREKEIDRDW